MDETDERRTMAACRYVLKIYKDDYSLDKEELAYVEYHKVHGGSKDNPPYLGAGKPLTFDVLQKLLAFGNEKQEDEYSYRSQVELLDGNILFSGLVSGTHHIIWWEKAHKQTILLVKKKPVVCMVPSMIYLLRGKEVFFAFALASNVRPKMDTPLYDAPFKNMYRRRDFTSSNVCFGNVKNETAYGDDSMSCIRKYKRYWWNSEFEGVTDLLKESLKAGKFPVKKLEKTKFTVKDLLK